MQTWVFADSIIQLQTPADVFRQEGEFKLTVFGNNIDEALDQVLDKSRHDFTIYRHQKIGYQGQFEPILEEHHDLNAFLRSFEERFFSLSIENGCDIFWHVSGTAGLTALFSIDFFEENRSWILSDEVCGAPSVECVRFKRRESGSMRGVKCRPCGLWQSIDCPRDEKPNETAGASGFLSYVKLTIHHKSKTILAKHKLRKIFLAMSSDPKLLSCRFDTPAKHNPSRINFSLESSGLNSEISQQDMQDLFYTPNVSHTARDLDSNKSQTLIFKSHQGKPLEYTTQKSCVESKDSSWNRPLLNDIPEGVRLLSVLAAGRRSSVVEVSSRTDEADPSLKLNNIGLPTMLTNFVLRWMHLEAGKVYVNAHSIPASAVPSTGSQKVFACCATTLRLKNGGIRVEDLTLLPPSSEFLKLALLSFGLSNHSFFRTIKQYEEKKCEDEKDNDTSRMRVELAIDFNHSCTKDLGKQLVCFPDKVFLLCKIFDLVDGHSVAPWDDLTHTSHLHSKASLSSGNSSARASVENGDGTNFPEENNDGFDGVKELVDMWTSDL